MWQFEPEVPPFCQQTTAARQMLDRGPAEIVTEPREVQRDRLNGDETPKKQLLVDRKDRELRLTQSRADVFGWETVGLKGSP